MIPLSSHVQVWLATGHTDMRKGFDGLALLVQETLKRNRWPGPMSVCEAAGARALRLAIDRSARRRRSHSDDHAGATGIFAGRHRLASAATHVASWIWRR